jgi:tRNA pseudouridine38-40 synthase
MKAKAFDTRLFKRILQYTKPYQFRFNGVIIFTISANRFLRNMVRAIVGTLVYVGLHKITLEDFNNIIASKNRSEAGFSVPAHGLYLTKIEYEYL